MADEDARVEFAAYRDEILKRSEHQSTLLTADLTALAAIVGFVLSDKADTRLLLVLPIVSSAIGLLWYDHARNIESLGDYIREEMPVFGGYERRIAALERKEWRRVPMTLALLILFVGVPVAGLVLTIDRVHHFQWLLWACGLALSVVCSVVLLKWMLNGLWPRPRSG
jgi:hypothetical protein